MIDGCKPGKDMLTILNDEPVKSSDDAVAKENSYSVVIAPPLVACGWNLGKHRKTHVSPIFT